MTVTSDRIEELVLPRSMTLDQWSRLDVERPVELVEGVPVVSPFELAPNIRVAMKVGHLVESAGAGLLAYPQLALAVSADDPATVRVPDLVVTRAEIGDVAVVSAQDVELVVEVVSATSVERDWVTKRAEYAAAGVPRYLVVDRFARRIVVFDEVVDGRYVEPADTDVARLRLDGAVCDITLAGLLS